MTILKQKFSHLIFDWDGTLMDSTGRIISAMQSTARKLELPIPSEKQVKSIIGLSMDAVLDKIFPEADQHTRQTLLSEYRYQYVESDDTPSPLFGGSLPLLNWLKQNQVTVSVATGKARHGLSRVLAEVELNEFFDHTICADESRSKPMPDMVHYLVEVSNIPIEETLVIGDSTHDLKMASNAGVDAVAVTSGADDFETLRQHGPLTILESVCQLKDWLIKV